MNLKTEMGWLRLAGILEGISFLVLLGICVPLKYLYNMPEAVREVGMAHGLLFIVYVYMVFKVGVGNKWPGKDVFIALLGSVLPFGTFYADAKVFKKHIA